MDTKVAAFPLLGFLLPAIKGGAISALESIATYFTVSLFEDIIVDSMLEGMRTGLDKMREEAESTEDLADDRRYQKLNSYFLRFEKAVLKSAVPLKINKDLIFDHVLKTEGGYVNNPADRGGETNFGVTQKTCESFYPGKKVKDLTKAEAREIYFRNYWTPLKLDMFETLPDCQLVLFDQGINRGVNSALRQAQDVLNSLGEKLLVDGLIGPKTITAFSSYPSTVFCHRYLQASILFYIEIVKKNPSQMIFLTGWCKRIFSLSDILAEVK